MSKVKINSVVSNKVSKRKTIKKNEPVALKSTGKMLGELKSFCTYTTKLNTFKAAMVETKSGTFRYLVHNLKPFVK